MNLRALLFDFDGTILDTEAAEFASVSKMFAEHGTELDRDRWISITGTAQSSDLFWTEWIEESIGRPIDREATYAEQRRLNAALITDLVPRHGIVGLLNAAATEGIPVGVVSSSKRTWVEGNLHRLDLFSTFDIVVTKEDAPRAKPFPDLYLRALSALDISRADARSVVAFEDSFNGSTAAVEAGLTTVACPNQMTDLMDFSHTHHEVESWADLDLDQLRLLSANIQHQY